ncbi:YkvA family protein [Alkaliphilus hydrothermalis]|uniref:Uncharacterized membrane protein YkvA (DUF1232 family) n=1 Tax=Alkaliphilus hydrothermalis TaxID=1482730 RepID=A0ABS2NTD5_9FIRM|nr:DUF1232 domain-containing protein [Alkaliphilus hydrothermalis]MBM7616234.1 uncharacterized membrane protein YkvA (DUF1232 family) [Alkaliphilus hydrothermalis]
MEDKEQEDYSKQYSEDSFWYKLFKFAKKAGVKVSYAALLLYYVLKKPNTPKWVKTSILGSLGYFIFPFDAVPDIIPLMGYGDDLGILAIALATAAVYIDEDVKRKAREKLGAFFKEYNEDELKEIDDKTKTK